MIELTVAGVIVLLAIGCGFEIKRRRQRRHEQIKEIEYLLDRVSEAATQRKTQLYQALESEDNPAIRALRAAAENSPVDISAEISQIEARWERLSRQLAEFSEQSVQSTLRSSVLTTRAAVTADDINQLASAAKAKLRH